MSTVRFSIFKVPSSPANYEVRGTYTWGSPPTTIITVKRTFPRDACLVDVYGIMERMLAKAVGESLVEEGIDGS